MQSEPGDRPPERGFGSPLSLVAEYGVTLRRDDAPGLMERRIDVEPMDTAKARILQQAPHCARERHTVDATSPLGETPLHLPPGNGGGKPQEDRGEPRHDLRNASGTPG